MGVSGWRYPPWRGIFYPKGLPQRDELRYASGRLNSVEINGSFYALQRPRSFHAWYEQTPDDFVFAVKGPRFITHLKKLASGASTSASFFMWVMKRGPLTAKTKSSGVCSYQAWKLRGRCSA